MDKYITLNNGKSYLKEDYIKAKTKDLIDFGYSDLTEETVAEQLEKALKGESLDVIGMFIKSDLYDREEQ